MVLAGLLLTCALSAPLAAAAEARLGAVFAPVPFILPGQQHTALGNITYSYDATAANATALAFAVLSGPAWLTAAVDPEATNAPAADPAGRSIVPVQLTLQVLPGAAALEQHTVQLRLSASANGPLNATNATVGIPVRVGFLGALRVEATQERFTGTVGEPVTVGLRLVNEGNGPTRVAFETRGEAPGVTALPPGPVLVETRGQLQDRRVNVSILPGQPGAHEVVLVYRSTHAFDQSLLGAGGELRVALDIAGAGLLPGPDPVLPLALAALGLALLRRRGRGLT